MPYNNYIFYGRNGSVLDMDLFKQENIKYATSIDWNCPKIVKRHKGDTQKLHKYSRRKLKNKLAKEISNEYRNKI